MPKEKETINKAEFFLENGNHILFYHSADVMNLINEYESSVKSNDFFFIGNWDGYVKELYYNGKRIDEINFSFPTSKVDLHKFEG